MAGKEPGPIDLVLAGGGVKGIGLVGAVVKLMEVGYRPYRISGTSAGAVVGSIVAASAADAAAKGRDLNPHDVRDLALKIKYNKFLDTGAIKGIPLLGTTWGMFAGNGIFRGDYAHDFVATELKKLGVVTFKDLKLADDLDIEQPERRYRLVVTVADVTRGQLIRLPWDYPRYGLDPDDQPVADAVRASMSIPFFFRPMTLKDERTQVTSTLVDGGLLSNFPLDSLDRTDGKPARWDTLGVTVLPNLPEGADKVVPGLGALKLIGGSQLLEEVISTVLVGHDQAYLDDPRVSGRTIAVDSTKVGVLDFGITPSETNALYAKGYEAAEQFLAIRLNKIAT